MIYPNPLDAGMVRRGRRCLVHFLNLPPAASGSNADGAIKRRIWTDRGSAAVSCVLDVAVTEFYLVSTSAKFGRPTKAFRVGGSQSESHSNPSCLETYLGNISFTGSENDPRIRRHLSGKAASQCSCSATANRGKSSASRPVF